MNPEITYFQLSAQQMVSAYSEAMITARKAWGEMAMFNVSARLPDEHDNNGTIILTLIQ